MIWFKRSFSTYRFINEYLKPQVLEAYVLIILYHYRAFSDLGFLNTEWLVGPWSVIIPLQSHLFICLGDSNILHLTNLSNRFSWENAIENTSYCFKKSAQEKSLCFKFLLRKGQYLADRNVMQRAIYRAWQPVQKTLNPHSYLLNCMNIAIG